MRASHIRAAAFGCCALIIGAAASAQPAVPPPATIPYARADVPMEPIELPREMAARAVAADAQQREGRTAEAEASYRALLAAAERDYGPESIETAQAIRLLAGLYGDQLRYTDAELLYRRQQTIVLAHYAGWRAAGRDAEVETDAARRGIDLYGESLGVILERQGRRGEAQVIWERAAARRAQAGAPASEPPERAAYGGLFAPGASRPDSPDAARAEALIEQRNYAEAEAIARALVARADGTEPQSSYLLARALRGQERWEEAAPLLERALAALPANGSTRFRIQVTLALADNHYRLGALAEAERLYRLAGDAHGRESGPHHPDTLSIRQMVAFLLGQQGRFAEAAPAYRAVCIGRVERARAFARGELVGEGSASRMADASECGGRFANALRRVALTNGSTEPEAALREEAFTAAQIFQQSAAGDSLARSGARTAAGGAGAGALADGYESRLAERTALDEGLRGATGDDAAAIARRAGLNAERRRLDGEIARFAVDLADRQPLYWDLRAPQPLPAAALQAATAEGAPLLRDDEALILFMVPRGAITGLVFAVSRRGAAWADITLTGDELEARVRALRAQIDPFGYGLVPAPSADAGQRMGSGAFDRQAAYDLYRALLGDPAIQAVIADAPTLLIVPSGPLTSLPPGLLVTAPPEGGAAGDSSQAMLRATPWLLRSKAIALLPSVASLRTLRRLLPAAPRPTEPLLAFTNPDFSGIRTFIAIPNRGLPRSMASYFRGGRPLGEALSGLAPLEGTVAEGAALARVLGAGPEAILTGAEASKAALFARDVDGRLARVRVIGFATHGLIAGDATGLVEPSLVLAAGATPEDGLLTASEAARLTIRADWVLLSACNTASPGATGADGLSGLARAFFHAGARSLLVSHWRVDDAIAPELVPAILAAMARDPSLSRAAAVRQASLAILDDPAIAAAHPAMWAPFTLVGEAGR